MNGELQVVPVIEVNVRYTMGRVAHAIEADLRKKGYTGSAQMLFHTKQELKRKQHSSFPELASQFSPGTYFQVTPLDSAKSTWVAVHLSN
jgi:hypothetical protein